MAYRQKKNRIAGSGSADSMPEVSRLLHCYPLKLCRLMRQRTQKRLQKGTAFTDSYRNETVTGRSDLSLALRPAGIYFRLSRYGCAMLYVHGSLLRAKSLSLQLYMLAAGTG